MLAPAGGRRRGRARRGAVFAALAVGILALTGLAGGAGARTPRAPASRTNPPVATGSFAAQEVEGAQRSLDGGGAGPGTAATACPTPPSRSFGCPASPSSVRPAAPSGGSPGDRAFAAMVYDPLDHYVLLFGGCVEPCGPHHEYNDSWSFAHGAWTRLVTPVAPSPRSAAGIAFDAADGYVLLFGGSNGATIFYNDTWSFVGGVWSKLPTSIAPSARSPGAFAYDPAPPGEVVLFGGNNASILGDTWTYTAGGWSSVRTSVEPPVRTLAMMAFDVGARALVLFGGRGNATLGVPDRNDTWAFAGGNWTAVNAPGAPFPREAGAFLDDPPSRSLVLYGGAVVDYPIIETGADTWTLQLHGGNGTWAIVSTEVSPTDRAGAAMVYSPLEHRVLLYGGENCQFSVGFRTCATTFGDAWSYANGTWTLRSSSVPPPRAEAALSWDGTDRYVLLFGGCAGYCGSDGYTYNDTWSYRDGTWTRLFPAVSPPARWNPGMTDDAKDGYVVLFGGFDGHDRWFDDVWSFAHGTWTQISNGPKNVTTPYPSARRPGIFVYDRGIGAVVMFGGQNPYSQALNDTWTFVAGRWTALSVGGPSPRWLAGAAFDARDGYLVLFGGTSPQRLPNATWTFANGTWTKRFPAVSPPLLAGSAMAVDPSSGSVILQGGALQNGTSVAETWVYRAGNWTLLTTLPHPSGREAGGLAPDPVAGDLVYFGGQGCTFGFPCPTADGTVWTYASGAWTRS